ncbi:hypothetical protein PBY51_021973 [Eleginops maclovinus]|uniref:Uncharacterized protein n=2 Tax=Eleginops maclovinus TaxID=56733 RepID=A0AAN8AF64_ELEMC|nr:hypothetical protein PBY51_021973 [Eleginops maclovinus]
MDMASLPPRKRPWQDGPGTGEREAPGPEGGRPPQREDGGYGPLVRGGRGSWGPGGGPGPRRGGPAPRGPPRGGRGR